MLSLAPLYLVNSTYSAPPNLQLTENFLKLRGSQCWPIVQSLLDNSQKYTDPRLAEAVLGGLRDLQIDPRLITCVKYESAKSVKHHSLNIDDSLRPYPRQIVPPIPHRDLLVTESYKQLAGGGRPRNALGLLLNYPKPSSGGCLSSQCGLFHTPLGPKQTAVKCELLCSSYQRAPDQS